MTEARDDRTAGVRAATTDDSNALRRLATDNGLFHPHEMSGFDEMLSGYLDGSLAGHQWIVLDDASSGVLGAAYYAPEPFADRVWNLYFLAAAPGHHRVGAGGTLVDHVESDLRRRGHDVARVLIVETSSGDEYEHARTFYGKHGFVEEARIREFYGPDDHKVVFWKSLV